MRRAQKLEKLSDIDLIKQYSKVISIMKERKILKSKNSVRDLGARYAVETYNDNPDLPDLRMVPPGVQNINAISKQGERYCFKSTTKALTGPFYGLNDPDSRETEIQKFEYVVIILLNEDFALSKVAELSWNQFLELKKWSKALNAWNISITKQVMSEAREIFTSGE